MSGMDYTDVSLVGEHDTGTGRLNLYAMVHGVPVLIASHKAGHYVPRINESKAKSEQDANTQQGQ